MEWFNEPCNLQIFSKTVHTAWVWITNHNISQERQTSLGIQKCVHPLARKVVLRFKANIVTSIISREM